MAWTAQDWTPDDLSVWLSEFQTEIAERCGATTQATDQSFMLARLLVSLSERFARIDRGLAEAMSLFDETVADGVALEIVAWRYGLARMAAQKSRAIGRAYGTPGQELAGQLARHDPSGKVWQLGPVKIGALGSGVVVLTCVETGPVPLPGSLQQGQEFWTRLSSEPGWTGVSITTLVSLGRDLESYDSLRARVARVRTAGGGVEGAILRALEAVSGVGVGGARVFVNRTSDVVDSIPPHYVEAVLARDEAGANDVGLALIGALASAPGGASGTAGTFGNRTVDIGNPQTGEPYPVRYSVTTTRRGYARIVVTVTGAPVPPSADLALLVRQYASGWAALDGSGELGGGDYPSASKLQAWIGDRVPAGMTVDIEALVSLDAVTYVAGLAVSKRERFTLSASASPAQIVGTKIGPFAIGVGWHMDFRVDGGADQVVTFTGAEVTLSDVLDTFAAAGLSGFGASESVVGTLAVTGESLGAGATLDLRVTTTPQLLLIFGGLVTGVVSGRDSDVEVSLV